MPSTPETEIVRAAVGECALSCFTASFLGLVHAKPVVGQAVPLRGRYGSAVEAVQTCGMETGWDSLLFSLDGPVQ